jgi:hypothetical protein
MTSYQKRKNEIAYLEQCVNELEKIAKELASKIHVKGSIPMLLLGDGITGDKYITPYNNGEFNMELWCNG